MKILVVDDSAIMRRINKNALMDHNVEASDFVEAKDGMEALKESLEQRIDLFLVDWNMPRLNGLSFVKKIRRMANYAETPIIMVTSEAAKYNVLEAIEGGVTDYIVKPVREDTFWIKLAPYIHKIQEDSINL